MLRAAAPLIAAIALVGANALALSPISAAVAMSFPGADAPTVMIAAALYGAATAVSALLLAPLIDRLGAARALALALWGLAIGLAASAAAPSVWMLAASQAGVGLAAGLALPAVYARAAEIAPAGREAETMGAALTGWTVSMVGGVALAGLITDAAHWRVFYALLAASALALAVGRHAAPSVSAPSPRAARQTSGVGAALAVPGVAGLLLAVAGYMIAFYGVYGYLGAQLVERLGVSAGAAGLAGVGYGVGFGLAALTDKTLDRIGAARASGPALLALAGVYAVLAGVADSPAMLLGATLAWGFVNHIALTLLIGQLSALAPARRGALLGLNSAVTYACVAVGTVAFRPIYETQGFATTALIAAGLALASALMLRRGRARSIA